MDRRTTIKWVLAASAAWPAAQRVHAQATAAAAAVARQGETAVEGYGTDPDLVTPHKRGEYWPLTLSAAQRRLAAALCDLIIPADDRSPGAAAVGAVDFIDEWVSAPYPRSQQDRPIVLEGLRWLDEEARRRGGQAFADAGAAVQAAICDDIASIARASSEHQAAARFFALYRDLTAAAFYSSPAGRTDLGYIGNVPLASFDGAPPELLKKLNLP
ncbi:MAG TPA: gluconate 2-dehydrogenase subunit 3 family protein [Steroidobacteraceae bacterium]|nr:gluconate 2-dehydrogenase subunit 3 family protein [Gammaproteobacteria bacterium]HEV2285762.1 gluconate 2-dehydrogenase subunit 3 family protein [Steroidobacteraceae bacterium]